MEGALDQPNAAASIDAALRALEACREPLAAAIRAASVADAERRAGDELSQTSYSGRGLATGVANSVVAAKLERARDRQVSATAEVSANAFDFVQKLAAAVCHTMALHALGKPVVADLAPLTQLGMLGRDVAMLPTDQALSELHQLWSVLGGLAGRLSSLER
jgi:hypothetical protein